MKRLIRLASAAIMLVVSSGWAMAATPPDQPAGMTMAQFQGLACLGTGTLGSLVAYAYTDMLVLTGTVVVNPVAIFAPVVATGFAFGCSIGATAAPGLFWLKNKVP